MSASGGGGQRSGRFLGSLKDALVAASREDTGRQEAIVAQRAAARSGERAGDRSPGPDAAAQLPAPKAEGAALSASEAAREAVRRG